MRLILFLLFCGLVAGGFFYALPRWHVGRSIVLVKSLGFSNVYPTSVERSPLDVSLRDIHFDDENISTAQKIVSSVRTGKIRMHIMDMELVGETNEDGLKFSGYPSFSGIFALNAQPFQLIGIRNLKSEILVEGLGGISAVSEFDIRHDKNKRLISFSGNSEAKQRNLSYRAHVLGSVTPDKLIAEINIDGLSVTFKDGGFPLSISRGNGKIQYEITPRNRANIFAEIQAGGGIMAGFPVKNITLSYKSLENGYGIIANARPLQAGGIEFSLESNGNTHRITIFAEDRNALEYYLKNEGRGDLVQFIVQENEGSEDVSLIIP